MQIFCHICHNLHLFFEKICIFEYFFVTLHLEIQNSDMSEREFAAKLRQGLIDTAKQVVEEHRRNNQPLILSEDGVVQYVDPYIVAL